jgi:hypothetical protein
MRNVARPTVALTPAMVFVLMTGEPPAVRLRGWVTLAQAGTLGEPSVEDVWTQHREIVIAAAQAHDFGPYWLTKRTPTGPGYRRWRDAFLAEHRY